MKDILLAEALVLQRLWLGSLTVLELGNLDFGDTSLLSGDFELRLQRVSDGLGSKGHCSVQSDSSLLVRRHCFGGSIDGLK